MKSKILETINVLIMVVGSIILMYAIALISSGYYQLDRGLTLLITVLGFLLVFGLGYGFFWLRTEYFSKEIEFDEIEDDRSIESSSVEARSKRKSGILNIFSSEDECDTCGTEMEYKEEMDCYYCPECREYKGTE